MVDAGCGMKERDRSIFEITGMYMPNGDIYSLGFGEVWGAGARNLEEMTFDSFVAYCKDYIQKSEAERIKQKEAA